MSSQIILNKISTLRKNKVPGQVIIQMTDHCNALCPQCGMRKTAQFDRTKLDKDKIKKIIDKAVENGVEAMSFTGGEPLLFLKDLVELINYAGAAGIKYIRTGTNGFLLRSGTSQDEFDTRVKRVVESLASTPVRNFWISVDSADSATHEEMRGFKGLIQGIEKALPLFHEAGLYPSVNLGINRKLGGSYTENCYKPEDEQDQDYYQEFLIQYRKGIEKFYTFVINMGFTTVNMCYPMSVQNSESDLYSVYTATSRDNIVNFSNNERRKLYEALLDIIPQYRSKIRIFTPLSSLYALKRQYEGKSALNYPCRGGVDFFFIDSKDGQTYPCGFRGNESFGNYEDMDMDTIDRKAFCTKCDWECFRDPSVLFGPALEGLNDPVGLFRRHANESRFFELWRKDIAYYEACDLFDGRKAPNYAKLSQY
ncbi:MAG: radical SAM protein [Candidatus Omnitrophica bacterium]|nr:radical SAM protein [Candidatus Omnitrophota bacterium]